MIHICMIPNDFWYLWRTSRSFISQRFTLWLVDPRSPQSFGFLRINLPKQDPNCRNNWDLHPGTPSFRKRKKMSFVGWNGNRQKGTVMSTSHGGIMGSNGIGVVIWHTPFRWSHSWFPYPVLPKPLLLWVLFHIEGMGLLIAIFLDAFWWWTSKLALVGYFSSQIHGPLRDCSTTKFHVNILLDSGKGLSENLSVLVPLNYSYSKGTISVQQPFGSRFFEITHQ